MTAIGASIQSDSREARDGRYLKTVPWGHQKHAIDFLRRVLHAPRAIEGRPAPDGGAAYLAMYMGCIDGEAEITVNRAGRMIHTTIADLHFKMHGGETNQRRWSRDTPTHTASLTDTWSGYRLKANKIRNVVFTGHKEVVRLKLANWTALRLTPDHRVAQPDGVWTPAGELRPGALVLTSSRAGCKPEAVISVEPDGTADVYDIEMAAPWHNFVAAGMVVHNCGKTLVGISMLCNLPIETALIVCPLRVVDVWPQQIQQHAGRNDLRVLALGDGAGAVKDKAKEAEFQMSVAKASGQRLVVVINYESIWREPFRTWALKQQWGLAIADEIHRGKSASGKQSMFLARLRDRCIWRLGLSGTPLPHSPLDAYAQYRFLAPELFGGSYQTFKMRYAIMGGYQAKMVVGFRELDDLEFRMKQIMFRVGKDVLDLPPEHRITRTCELSPGAAKIYDQLEREFVAEVKNGVVTAANAMVKLLRLQQVTGGFAKTDHGDTVAVDVVNAKAELLADILEDLDSREPVVVFCRFHADLDTVHATTKQLGRTSAELSGRRDELKMWQAAGGPAILAAQIQSGGIGVDLTRAAYSIYYSLGYSLGEYDQSLARVHRPGQTREVAQIMLVASGTVDEKVVSALQKRMDIVGSILEGIKRST